jgi:hypothetical protein
MKMLVICCLVMVMNGTRPVEEGKRSVSTVNAEELSSGKCRIIGLLGKPYGSIVSVKGVWEGWEFDVFKLPVGEKPFSLRITELDGKRLAPKRQIVIDAAYVKWLRPRPGTPLRGERVEGRVYESGGYVRHPEAVNKILGVPESQDYFRFCFYSFLYFIDYKLLGGGEKPKVGGQMPEEPHGYVPNETSRGMVLPGMP